MGCPKCGCKVTYPYDDGWDMQIGDETRERCAACGHVFDEFDAADEDDDEIAGATSGEGASRDV